MKRIVTRNGVDLIDFHVLLENLMSIVGFHGVEFLYTIIAITIFSFSSEIKGSYCWFGDADTTTIVFP